MAWLSENVAKVSRFVTDLLCSFKTQYTLLVISLLLAHVSDRRLHHLHISFKAVYLLLNALKPGCHRWYVSDVLQYGPILVANFL